MKSGFLTLQHGNGMRAVALAVLASSGADLDLLYGKLFAVEGTNGSGAVWDFLFLQMASKRPFAAALCLFCELSFGCLVKVALRFGRPH